MDFDFTTLPNEDAARAIAYKTPVGRKVFDKLLPELKARAFVVTGLEELRALRAIRDAIAELPRGLDWDTVKKKVMAELYAGDFSEKACEARAELLIRHHGFMAYSMADYEVKQQVKDSFPYWKYQTMGDHRVRASHAALDGLVLPADHPFWKDHYPPWEWGCRCQIIEITEDEYNEIKGRTPGSFNPTEDEKAQGWTLTPEGEKRLRDYGTLDDGSGVPVDVRSPRAKDGPEAYGWSPGESGLSLKDLEKKYGEEDFGKFRDIMRQCDIGDGRNAWDWLEGKKPPAPSGSAVVPPAKTDGKNQGSTGKGGASSPYVPGPYEPDERKWPTVDLSQPKGVYQKANKDRAQYAIDKLMTEKRGVVRDASISKKLGPIEVSYEALRHVEEKHGGEYVEALPGILAYGAFYEDNPRHGRAQCAILSKQDGKSVFLEQMDDGHWRLCSNYDAGSGKRTMIQKNHRRIENSAEEGNEDGQPVLL